MAFSSYRGELSSPSLLQSLGDALNKGRFFIGVVLSVGVSGASYGEDLLDVYRLALRNDPQFEIARYSLKGIQEKQAQAFAALLPTVNASGTNNLTRAQSQFSTSQSTDRYVHAWNWSLQLTQPLVRLQTLYAYKESSIAQDQAQAQFNLAEQDLILRTVEAYFGVLASRESIKVAEAELLAMEGQLGFAQRGFEKGVASMTDVKDGLARVALAQSHRVAAQNELDIKQAELGNIVDEVPSRLAALDATVAIPAPEPNDVQTWVSQAREHNAAVVAARVGLLVAEAGVGKARAEHAPTLDLLASYAENYSSGSATLPSDFAARGQSKQVGLQFNIPLFAGGGGKARVAESVAVKYRVAAELELAQRQAATEARLAFTGVVNGLSQLAALGAAVEASRNAADGNHVGYKVGIYSNIDVLNAEQQYHSVKRDLVKARYETLLQTLKLKAAAGMLNEDDLVRVNELFQYQ